MRGDEHRGAGRGQPLQPRDELRLALPIQTPRRLVEADEAGWLPAGAATGHRDREGEPLALAAGEVPRVSLPGHVEADGCEGQGTLGPGQLLVDPLANEVIVGTLADESAPARHLDRAARGLEQPRGGTQQRALAGAVGPDEGHDLSRPEAHLDAGEDLARPGPRVELDAQIAREQRRGGLRGGAAGLRRPGDGRPWPTPHAPRATPAPA